MKTVHRWIKSTSTIHKSVWKYCSWYCCTTKRNIIVDQIFLGDIFIRHFISQRGTIFFSSIIQKRLAGKVHMWKFLWYHNVTMLNHGLYSLQECSAFSSLSFAFYSSEGNDWQFGKKLRFLEIGFEKYSLFLLKSSIKISVIFFLKKWISVSLIFQSDNCPLNKFEIDSKNLYRRWV